MAPPDHTFPVSQLEQQIHYHSVNQKAKARKLGDFDLERDCELLELVQYSCTTPDQQYERALNSPTGTAQMECFPFVRLFRKYACLHTATIEPDSTPDIKMLTAMACLGARKGIKCSMSRQLHGRASMPGHHRKTHVLRHQQWIKLRRMRVGRRVGSGLRREPFA